MPRFSIQCFISMYLAAFEDYFPLIDRKIVHIYIKREPWFTSGLLTSSTNKSKLLSLKPTELNICKYKLFNNVYNKLVRTMKTSYFKKALEENKHNKNVGQYLDMLLVK